jgi:uncharacterized protein (TIGR02246 family)
MLYRCYCLCRVLPFWVVLGLSPVFGQDVDPNTEDPTSAIQDAVARYADAFNARDVAKLASAWTEEGVYISRISGERVDGREALKAQFEQIFSDSSDAGKLILASESIDLVSPRVAVESGRATVIQGEETIVTTYNAVFVKDGDQWLIDRVTEDEIPLLNQRYERLKALEWMIGQWVDAGEGYTVEIECDWTANQTYISRKYSITNGEDVSSSGLQLIGWDANQQQIRSWLFDSDGGFVTGTWTERDGVWKVQSLATLADGSSGSFVGIYRPTEDGNFTWQKVNQIIDGELWPNLDEVTIVRK